jgi:hypothetical protein
MAFAAMPAETIKSRLQTVALSEPTTPKDD